VAECFLLYLCLLFPKQLIISAVYGGGFPPELTENRIGMRMGEAIIVIRYFVLAAGVTLIFFGAIGTFMTRGFEGLREVFNPFNVFNFIASVIVTAPGVLLIAWGKRLRTRNHNRLA
jgi:hypothetical protein